MIVLSVTVALAAPQSIAMTHVITSSRAAYQTSLQYSWASMAPYLSWVQTDPPYAAGARLAGIKPFWYTNPNRQASGQILYTSDESTFAHDCLQRRIHDTASYLDLMQPSSSDLTALWLNVSQSMLSRVPYSAVFEDDTDDVYGVDQLPCSYSASQWLSDSVGETSVLWNHGIPVIYNALSLLGPDETVSPSIAMNRVTIGGMMENCYIRPSTTNSRTNGKGWAAVEDTEIDMAREDKLFFCYADDYLVSASSAIALRTYAYASFLLSYDPSTSIYETNFIDKNDFNVMPESGLVALSPLTPAPTSASDLLTSTGAFARQYGACYLRGVYVGACAAVVNADAFHAHQFPFAGYKRTLALSGGNILAGGSLSVWGAAPAGQLAPLTAVIAFK